MLLDKLISTIVQLSLIIQQAIVLGINLAHRQSLVVYLRAGIYLPFVVTLTCHCVNSLSFMIK